MKYAIIVTLCIHLCILVVSLPFDTAVHEDNGATAQQGLDYFGFPEGTEKVEERPSNSCYVHVASPDNGTVRQCCDGYTGVECNILADPFQASNPCNNQTCPNDPEAQCAVVNQCGMQVAVFLNDLGQIVDCGDAEGSTPDRDIAASTLSCQGFCDFDPCKAQTCSPFPDAFCFQSGCDCEPIWILETGVQVNCTTGTAVNSLLSARRRRQAAMAVVPQSCSS